MRLLAGELHLQAFVDQDHPMQVVANRMSNPSLGVACPNKERFGNTFGANGYASERTSVAVPRNRPGVGATSVERTPPN
jgi:hypothetical protein